jgi:hypothetical protein
VGVQTAGVRGETAPTATQQLAGLTHLQRRGAQQPAQQPPRPQQPQALSYFMIRTNAVTESYLRACCFHSRLRS